MTGSEFPFLSDDALSALSLLGGALHIYDFNSERIVWANQASLKLWNAISLNDLTARELTPYSEATKLRLSAFLASFRKGEVVEESWTFFPQGNPTPTMSRCSGVSLEGVNEAMLVEARILTPVDLPARELRAIEALRHTSLLVSMFTQSGKVLMRNPAAQAAFGAVDLAAEESGTTDQFAAMFANRREAQILLDDAKQSGGTAIRTATMSIDGAPTHAVQISLTSDPASGDITSLVTQQDMTVLATVCRQLRESEAALEAVLSLNASPVIVIARQTGSVLRANPAAQMLLGAELTNNRLMSELCINVEFEGLCAAIDDGSSASMHLQMRRSDSDLIWASASGAKITYDRQDALVLFLTDVSALHQAAAELEAELDAERLHSKVQQRSIAMAAHDLRTPLAVIDNTAQMLERSLARSSEDQIKARLGRIRTTVIHMLHLMENTMDAEGANQATLGFLPKPGAIGDIIYKFATEFQDSHPELQLSMHLQPVQTVKFDERLIERALGNLLSNAMKYADGTPVVEISLTPGIHSVQIIVRDHGIGIPEADRGKIFDHYTRAVNTGDRPGKGLGLAIVKQIAGLHGGRIEVVDTVGPGSTFVLTLSQG